MTLIALGATMLVQGGWQAAAAGLGIFTGIGFALSFAALGAASERTRPRYPAWALTSPAPRRTALAGQPEPPRVAPARRRAPRGLRTRTA